jgi:hypothetical protein
MPAIAFSEVGLLRYSLPAYRVVVPKNWFIRNFGDHF